jgi:adenine-specific DNA-methyltransferase
VANTAGTYYAYLKSWTAKARKTFEFRPVAPTPGPPATAILGEAADVAERHGSGILYLDPPYNRRCYARYYHLPETLARLETPRLRGESGMPLAPRPASRFTSPPRAGAALAELLERSSAPKIVFHYTRDGLIDLADARSHLARLGDVTEHALVAPGYTTRSTERRVVHTLLVMRRG